MLDMRYARQRSGAYHAELQSRFTLSFGDYQDPKQVGFSSLLVMNEDVIEPSKAVRTHSHQNMEIITYVLEHKDSMDKGQVITQGDIQLMSAGSGVLHFHSAEHAEVLIFDLQTNEIPKML